MRKTSSHRLRTRSLAWSDSSSTSLFWCPMDPVGCVTPPRDTAVRLRAVPALREQCHGLARYRTFYLPPARALAWGGKTRKSWVSLSPTQARARPHTSTGEVLCDSPSARLLLGENRTAGKLSLQLRLRGSASERARALETEKASFASFHHTTVHNLRTEPGPAEMNALHKESAEMVPKQENFASCEEN